MGIWLLRLLFHLSLDGGGVDNAIHRIGEADLLHECLTLDECKTGDAKIIKGYRLPAKFIIHTVGPVWHDGKTATPNFLHLVIGVQLKSPLVKGLRLLSFQT